jgi:tetrahydromethanopterin S-methyltransferase subunit H
MSWNHRVVKKQYPNGEIQYSVREVFYNEDSTIYAYTENPVDIAGESISDLKVYLQWCLDCLDKPVLIDGEVDFVDNNPVYKRMPKKIKKSNKTTKSIHKNTRKKFF